MEEIVTLRVESWLKVRMEAVARNGVREYVFSRVVRELGEGVGLSVASSGDLLGVVDGTWGEGVEKLL